MSFVKNFLKKTKVYSMVSHFYHSLIQDGMCIMADICLAFLPLYVLTTLFGIMPFNYRFFFGKPTSATDLPLRSSVVKLAISVSLLVVTVVHGISAPFYVLHTCMPESHEGGIFKFEPMVATLNVTSVVPRGKENKQSLIMKILNPLLVTFICVTARVVAIFSLRAGLRQFFRDVKQVDSFLRHIAGFRKFVSTRKHLAYSTGLSVLFVVAALPINTYYLIRVAEVNNRMGLIWCTLLVWSNLTGFCCEILFIFCTYLIRSRFKIINYALTGLVVEENNAAAFQYSIQFQRQFGKSVCCVSKDSLNNYNLYRYKDKMRKSVTFGNSLADTIEIYRHCHRLLCKLVWSLNKMYKLHLLMTLAACFLKSLFNIYFAMFGYVIGTATTRSAHPQWEYFSTAYWNTYYVVRFLLVTGMAHITAAQGVRTRYLISAMSNRFLDPNTKEELALFMNHITNTKIEFTACDFFTLNTHLITSAIAAGTTYLVILVQFHSDKDT